MSAKIRVVGTDLLGVEFSQSLYEFAARERLELALAFDGSRPAVDQLKQGRADVALVVLPADEQTAFQDYPQAVIAYHRVIALAPTGCPLDRISMAELAAIFGTSGASPITRWSGLGVGGEWAGSTIAAVAPQVSRGVTLAYFRRLVLNDAAFKSTVVRYSSATELASYFGGESRALVLADAWPAAASAAKVLALSSKPRAPAYLPTAENLHSGDYPLRLPVRVVYRAEAAATLRPLLRFLLSDAAAPQFERARLVPAPAAARAEQALALKLN